MRALTMHQVAGAETDLKVIVADEPGCGGANHKYVITGFDTRSNASEEHRPTSEMRILFQNGAIPEKGVNGVTHEALLAILFDRLSGFQQGQFACDDNARALDHIDKALFYLQQRTVNRVRRNVEGKHEA